MYLLRGGRYASCVHAGVLFVSSLFIPYLAMLCHVLLDVLVSLFKNGTGLFLANERDKKA